jgi:hypothetical protein
MIRRMKIISAMAIAVICGLSSVNPAFAQNDTASTKYFSAKVVNIRRAATGKTLVTVLYNSLAQEIGLVTLRANTRVCRESATFIDGNGEEYGTLRCMSLLSSNSWDRFIGTGMRIDGGTSASFVYEFSTPLSTDVNAKSNINILIPIFYTACPKGEPSGSYNSADGCIDSTTTLSFYGLTAR